MSGSSGAERDRDIVSDCLSGRDNMNVSGTQEVMSVSSIAAGLATLQAGYNSSPIANDTTGLKALVIHGLYGGNWSSWISENGFNWLVESIPKAEYFPGARVLSYSYTGLDIESAAEELIASLIQDRTSLPEVRTSN
ncbi:hypothetical protein QBC37DRAFT_380467 [Rhypophila decipiens]|uniref:Uncharacterized protein n=1 Tax=Rhypophila decipiens TaxID=261697 RepID=A0AAN6XUE1_9PEZI|nr:hypothetical protein QBC37DRAFT_380467 [Rhypophila decipiens]